MIEKLINKEVAVFLIVVGVLLSLVFIVVFMHPAYLIDTTKPADTELISQYGDLIGGVTGSLWALAGVILFYLALDSQEQSYRLNRRSLNKQVRALKVQIKEYKSQGKVLERSARAQERTVRMLNKQINLSRSIGRAEAYATLAHVNSKMAAIEGIKSSRTEYKLKSKEYMDILLKEIENGDLRTTNNDEEE